MFSMVLLQKENSGCCLGPKKDPLVVADTGTPAHLIFGRNENSNFGGSPFFDISSVFRIPTPNPIARILSGSPQDHINTPRNTSATALSRCSTE